MANLLDDYLLLSDLAAELGVKLRTAQRWAYATSPGLPVHHIARKAYVKRADFDAWMEARRVQKNVGRR